MSSTLKWGCWNNWHLHRMVCDPVLMFYPIRDHTKKERRLCAFQSSFQERAFLKRFEIMWSAVPNQTTLSLSSISRFTMCVCVCFRKTDRRWREGRRGGKGGEREREAIEGRPTEECDHPSCAQSSRKRQQCERKRDRRRKGETSLSQCDGSRPFLHITNERRSMISSLCSQTP